MARSLRQGGRQNLISQKTGSSDALAQGMQGWFTSHFRPSGHAPSSVYLGINVGTQTPHANILYNRKVANTL